MPEFETTLLSTKDVSNQLYWRLDEVGDQVQLMPVILSPKTVLTHLGVIALGIGGYLFSLWPEQRTHDPMPRYVWIGLYVSLQVFALVWTYRGLSSFPRLSVDRVKQTLTLLNTGQVWPLQHVVGWQIIQARREHSDPDEPSETQWLLLVRQGEDVVRHLLITGLESTRPENLRTITDELAATTRIPLVSFVKEGRDEFAAGV
jgi:hypothetical protein